MKENLTENEILKIEQFCNDEAMFGAVKKAISEYLLNPLKSGELYMASLAINNPIPDEIIGQNIRAVWSGINTFENAIKELKSIKAEKKDGIETPYNEAV